MTTKKRAKKRGHGQSQAAQALADVKSIIEAARAAGASSVTLSDGTTLHFDNKAAPKQPVPDLKAEDLIKPESVFDQMTEDEILFWSTNYYDELQSKKAAMEAARKERE